MRVLVIACAVDHEALIDVARRQLAVDPVNGDAALGWVLLRAGQPAEAAVHYERSLALRPGAWAQANLAASYSALGKHAEAVRQCEQAMQDPFGALTWAFCASIYAAAGQQPRAETIVRDVLERARQSYVDPFAVGVAFLSLDPSRSLDWFEKAYKERSPNIVGGLRHSPWIRRVEESPRLQQLISLMQFPTSNTHP